MLKLNNRDFIINTRHLGFSLVEALVVLVLSAMLMSTFAQIYLSSSRSHQRLLDYTQSSRTMFYSRQQLRLWLQNIVIPPGQLAGEDNLFSDTSIRRLNRDKKLPPLRGDRTSMTGVLYDTILENHSVRPFTLSKLVEADPVAYGMNGHQVELHFHSQEERIKLNLSKKSLLGFAYIDRSGRQHASWPPEKPDTERSGRFEKAPTSLVEYLRLEREKYEMESMLPQAIVVEFGAGAVEHAMVIEIY